MSKSRLNGVDPQHMVDQYGADATRLFMMFAAPPEQTLEWSDTGIEGAYRFIRRIWQHVSEESVAASIRAAGDVTGTNLDKPLKDARRQVHEALRQINADYERKQFNTVVSGAMKLFNTLDDLPENGEGLERVEHTSELQSRENLVCRLLLEKKKKTTIDSIHTLPKH